MENIKLALAMIVKGSDSEAVYLEQCLNNVSSHVDKIFITITRKENEETNQKVKEVAEKYNAQISDFVWVNDFSKARNFNFSQVPSEYTHILWCDADDVFENLGNLKKIISSTPSIDAYYMMYVYAKDEWGNAITVHPKVQLVKNNGGMYWVREIHENLNETRTINYAKIEDIYRVHMTTNEKMVESMERNLDIAIKEANDTPNEPRVWWNLGRTYSWGGKYKEANEALQKFIEMSSHLEENYLTRLMMMVNYYNQGMIKEAIESGQIAIGMFPEFPDAYFHLGQLYKARGQYAKALELYKSGIGKKPPTMDLSVYNPRDYDYNPMKEMAELFAILNMPKMAITCYESCLKIYPNNEKLKEMVGVLKKEVMPMYNRIMNWVKKLNDTKTEEEFLKVYKRIPQEIKQSPHICYVKNQRIIKTETSGKEISIYCGETFDVWNPEIARTKGIGGSEEAVIHLAKRFKKAGYDVFVYNNCGLLEQEYDGVIYRPWWQWNHRDKQDYLILWRHFKLLDDPINATKIFVDVHDVMPEGEITEERLKKIDKIFVKSEFHRSLYPKVPDDKFAIIPNGIDVDVFSQELERDQYLMINTSSPDRGLTTLVELFSRVKEKVPEAKLKWAYGWGVFDAVNQDKEKLMLWKEEMQSKMRELGIEELGRISHEDVAKLYMTASIFAYPTEFAEIHCISAAKAQAGGAIPITTNFSALDETVQFGTKIKIDINKDNWCPVGRWDFSLTDEKAKQEWVDKVVEILQNPPTEEHRKEMREWAKQQFNWDNIANKWLINFN